MVKKAIYEEIGKTLAPVEIDSDEAMEMFGITKKDLVPFMVRNKRIMVYPYPAPEEVCREMLQELKDRYIYDRSIGKYWKTRKVPSTGQQLEIERRKKSGESMGDILSSMKLL